MEKLEYKFLKLCQEKKFFKKGQRVLVALSGGQDSQTLFNWLYDLQNQLEIELAVAHVNHKQREESDMEEKALETKMKELKVPFYLATFDKNIRFTEENGRKFRYDFFKKLMLKNAYDVLVTAHHKDDQVETFLMRQLTGRRLVSLKGIAERQAFASGELIRPLLSFSKEELSAKEYFEDVTNRENEHLRNRFRNIYIPQMTEENPQFSEAIYHLNHEISLALDIIQKQIEESGIIACAEVSVKDFLKQSEALQYYSMQAYFERYYPEIELSRAKLVELLHLIRRPQQYSGYLSQDYNFVKESEKFYLAKAEEEVLKIDVREENPYDESYMELYLPQDANYQVRSRMPGDKFQNGKLKQSLKKYFINEKIPLRLRNSPLIAIDSEIYAIPYLQKTSLLSERQKNDKIYKIIWVKPLEFKEIKDA